MAYEPTDTAMLRAYRRFRAWADELPRGAYAALMGAWGGGSMFAFGALLNYQPLLEQAPVMAATMFVIFYLLDPRQFEV
jgi:hypothetical protein